VGWIDGDNVYLEPDASYRVVKRYANEQNENLPLTQRTLWKRMADKNLLASREKGKNVAKVTVEGERRYVVHILATALSEEEKESPGGRLEGWCT